MDDGGQRLLDVIEDTHVLETFLRENFSNSGLEDATRYDHASVSAESSLAAGAGLDSFMFDGQLVDPLRGGPSHPSHHTHQVSPHILQGVLHSPNLSTTSALAGASHHLHPHHQLHQSHHHHHHHQPHHLQQSHLIQQHHSQSHHHQHPSQLHSTHPALQSPVGSSLEADCIVRARESCNAARNESDHALQQLLASAPPLGSSQQLLQLHQQSHQIPLHQAHNHLQQLTSHSHQQHVHSQHAAPQTSPIMPTSTLTSSASSHHLHHSQVQHRQHSSQNLKSQHQHHSPSAPDVSSNLLPLGMSSILSSSNGITNSNISSNPTPHIAVVSHHDHSRSPSKHSTSISSVSTPSSKVIASTITTTSVVQSGAHNVNKVQVVGTQNQVISSVGQIFSTSQVLSNSQILQPGVSTHIISQSSVLPSNQAISNASVLPGGQGFPGNNLMTNASLMTNNIVNTQPLVTSTKNISPTSSTSPYAATSSSSPSSSSYITPLTPSIQKSIGHQNMATSSSSTSITSPSALPSFAIPNKSPSSSLPRTSPNSSYSATPPHQATHSPASYPIKSPAPSPHSHASLKSPLPPPSPVTNTNTISASQSTQTIVSSNSLTSPRVIPGLVPSLVTQLPVSQVCASNGLVLSQSASLSGTHGMKQVVPSGQVIQLVSSQNSQCRQAIAIPHPKPIQPKQPQLLPKPSPQGRTVSQPTPPPPGKTLIGSRLTSPCTQQPIVLGAGSQPTVIAGQQNIGSIVLNSSLLQAGLQQPFLIPQPNGVQLLVRPMGQPSGAGGQALLVPVPNQTQVVTSMGKTPQHQALVIPGSGQGPALVIPQGITPTLGGTSMLSTTQAARPAPQPILRFVAPQAPLQLQQINTPSGPMFVAVPMGQTALNLPHSGMFAAPSPVRALAPQVAPGTLQIGSSLGPISLNSLQLSAGGLQVSSNNHLPSLPSLSSVPTPLTKPTEIVSTATSNASHGNLISTKPNAVVSIGADVSRDNKKKSKKKKKEKESKEDKGKNKTVSINLNELLKETGIFDENEFGGLGIEESDASASIITSTPQVLLPNTSTALSAASVSANSDVFKISSCGNQIILNSSASSPMYQSQASNSAVLTLGSGPMEAVATPQATLPITNMPSGGMCLTLDASGKLVLSEAVKPQISTITGSLPTQVIQSNALQMLNPNVSSINSGGTIVIGNSEALRIPVSKTTSAGMPNLFSLQPPAAHAQLVESNDPHPCYVKLDNVVQPKRLTSEQNDHMKTIQNTQIITTQANKLGLAVSSSLGSFFGNNFPSVISGAAANADADVCLRLSSNEKNVLGGEMKTPVEFSIGAVTNYSGAVTVSNGNVIVSSNYANNIFPNTLITGGGKTNVILSPNNSIVNSMKHDSKSNSLVSSSTNNVSSDNQGGRSQYSSNANTVVVDSKVKKSSKKKKKNKELPPVPQLHPHSTSSINLCQIGENKDKIVVSTPFPLPSSIFIPNGDINLSPGVKKLDGIPPTNLHSHSSKVHSSPNNQHAISNVLVSVTSNSIVSTLSNTHSSANVSVAPSTHLSAVNGATKVNGVPFAISTHSNLAASSSGGFIVQPGHQVKQLLLSPQNQEALKRVHTQIQDLQQAKKGPLREQDKALQQKLISEYKKIMATGTPVPVSHTLGQPVHNLTPTTQSSVKYSHSVGHKKIIFTPNQKKGSSSHSHQSKKCSPSDSTSSKANSSSFKSKEQLDGLGVNLFIVSTATSTLSSQTSPSTTSSGNTSVISSSSSDMMHGLVPGEHSTGTSLGTVVVGGGSKGTEKHKSDSQILSGVETVISGTSRGSLNASMPIIIAASTTRQSVLGTTSGFHTQGQASRVSHGTTSKGTLIISSHSPGATPSVQPSCSPTSRVVSAGEANPSQHSVTVSQHSSPPVPASGISPVRTSFSLPLTRDQLFEHQLRTDQNGALNPDYKFPFKNKIDACKRLIRFHVYDEPHPTPTELLESDTQFEYQSESLIKKFKSMKYKYQSLLLKDSLRRHPSSETAMLYRLFIQEEKHCLERQKLEVSKGKDLNLCSPPPYWLTGEVPSPGDPYPWEADWPDEKVYGVTRKPEELGESSDDGDLINTVPQRGDGPTSPHWEIEEGPLQIMMDEEEDGRSSERPVSSATATSSTGNTDRPVSSLDSLPCPGVDSLDQLEAEIQEEYLDDDRVCRGPAEDSPDEQVIEASFKATSDADSFAIMRKSRSGRYRNGEHTLVPVGFGLRHNGLDDQMVRGGRHGRECRGLFDPSDELRFRGSVESLDNGDSDSAPTSENLEISHQRYESRDASEETYLESREVDCNEKRNRKHRDKYRKHDRRKDRGELERRSPSRKLKIKVKGGEDPADLATVVPPLRIRSDGADLRVRSKDRSTGHSFGSGGLKLTLKKQEGSGDYYRVGNDPDNQECGIVTAGSDQENALLVGHPGKRKFEFAASNGKLKGVSVVLEDCLQPDPKGLSGTEEFTSSGPETKLTESGTEGFRHRHRSSSKRNKRLKSHHYHNRVLSTESKNIVNFEPSVEKKKENVSHRIVSESVDHWGSKSAKKSTVYFDSHRHAKRHTPLESKPHGFRS